MRRALAKVAEETRHAEALVFVGLPLAIDGELYNVAAALNDGKILGFTTKTFLPNYGNFMRCVNSVRDRKKARVISYEGEEILFGPQILYQAAEMDDLVVSAEICEDVWSPIPPSIEAAREGAIIPGQLFSK